MLLSLLAKSFGSNQWNCLAHRSLNGFFIALVDSRTAYTELLPKSNTIFKGNPLPFICSYWSRNSSAAVFINNPPLSLYECHNHSFGKFPLLYEYTFFMSRTQIKAIIIKKSVYRDTRGYRCEKGFVVYHLLRTLRCWRKKSALCE